MAAGRTGGRSIEIHSRSRRAASGCSRPAMCAMARPSASPQRSERARWSPRSSSTVSPSSVSASELAAALTHARRRTEALLEPLSVEELWLLRRVGGLPPLSAQFDDFYDSFAHARSERAGLPILSPEAARAYLTEVREAVLDLLPELS